MNVYEEPEGQTLVSGISGAGQTVWWTKPNWAFKGIDTPRLFFQRDGESQVLEVETDDVPTVFNEIKNAVCRSDKTLVDFILKDGVKPLAVQRASFLGYL